MRYKLDEIDSTNKFILSLSKETPQPEGTLVSAEYQTDGKGQIGRYWHSEKGKNLLCSILLKPSFLNPEEQFVMSQMIALALKEVIGQYTTEKVSIKWPNDLYINDDKVCGILIQNQLKGKFISKTIIGFGLNVNQADFPQQLPNPTSLFQQTGQVFDREAILQEICDRLEHYYLLFKSGRLIEINERYHEVLFRKDQVCQFRENKTSIFEGVIIGIGEYGKLRVKTIDEVRLFDFREIEMIL